MRRLLALLNCLVLAGLIVVSLGFDPGLVWRA